MAWVVKIKIVFIATILLVGKLAACASGYTYEKRETDGHVIHIVSINPKDYAIEIIKANNGAIGRESVPSMAARTHAEIAINGGFFEIGASGDGMPSGTLVINGRQYGLKDQIQPLVLIDSGVMSIVLSKPQNYMKSSIFMISGIPLLIIDGEIFQDLATKDGEFYTKPHARTAVGSKPDGTIILVVAEHNYSKDLTAITMGEVQSLIKEKGDKFAKEYHRNNPGDITLNELKMILKQEYTSQSGTQGLTILELAGLMKELGCQDALNLDGGGSSTLWIKGKVINQTIGDKDEGNGLQMIRPVSDAIIFKKR
ncbi:MAG: phosphodiester glycosidase family protein [Alphaproteobacteria bacterium]